eukprot:s1731_g3.t1
MPGQLWQCPRGVVAKSLDTAQLQRGRGNAEQSVSKPEPFSSSPFGFPGFHQATFAVQGFSPGHGRRLSIDGDLIDNFPTIPNSTLLDFEFSGDFDGKG